MTVSNGSYMKHIITYMYIFFIVIYNYTSFFFSDVPSLFRYIGVCSRTGSKLGLFDYAYIILFIIVIVDNLVVLEFSVSFVMGVVKSCDN